jgi:hypothetical protein
MTIDLTELHPTDYVVAGFFDQQPAGVYALQLAQALHRFGVSSAEWKRISSELADQLDSSYYDSTAGEDTRDAIRQAGRLFEKDCPPAAEFLARSAEMVTCGRNLATLIVHLGRAGDQLALLELAKTHHA